MTLIEPIGFLRDQAIRMRRVKWPNAWMLADELWLILSALEPAGRGTMTVNPDTGGDGYQLPTLPPLTIPPLDMDIPTAPPYGPTNDQQQSGGRLQQTSEECFWHRSVLLALITGLPPDGSSVFQVTLYPNAFLGNSCVNKWLHDAETPTEIEDTATGLGDTDGVDVGDYVLVFHAAQWVQTITTLRDADTMALIGQETELSRLQYQNVFIAPAGGGGTVGQTTSRVSALTGNTPGEGTMQRYRLVEGTLVAQGQPVTVYSSVRVAVDSGKWIQAKKIGGQWWADVEDCLYEDEGY